MKKVENIVTEMLIASLHLVVHNGVLGQKQINVLHMNLSLKGNGFTSGSCIQKGHLLLLSFFLMDPSGFLEELAKIRYLENDKRKLLKLILHNQSLDTVFN